MGEAVLVNLGRRGYRRHLGAPFIEGDGLPPQTNVAKMPAGIPLSDTDRWPWLSAIAARVAAEPAPVIVVSCSSLKRACRDLLRTASGRPVGFRHLHGTEAVLPQRMSAREGHFMPPALFVSKLAAQFKESSVTFPPFDLTRLGDRAPPPWTVRRAEGGAERDSDRSLNIGRGQLSFQAQSIRHSSTGRPVALTPPMVEGRAGCGKSARKVDWK